MAVKSPIGGYVKSCPGKGRRLCNRGTTFCLPLRNSPFTVEAEVSERYYAGLKSIVSANFTTTYDDKVYRLDEFERTSAVVCGKSSGDTSITSR